MNYKYFDTASTTKVDESVIEKFNEANDEFFNPSALYLPSVNVKLKIEKARDEILRILNGKPKSRFIFTGSASEANNTVLRSVVRRKDKKYIISSGEHSSIYMTAKALINEGYNIEFAPIDKSGRVDKEILYSMIDDKTDFLSLIHVSNETGAINDIKEITKKVKSINPNILVHSDGVQAVKKFDIDLTDLGVDYYTISSHKINGLKGIAGLYVAPNSKIIPLIYGGGQEFGLRAGTENYPLIASFLTAMKLKNLDMNKLSMLKELFLKSLTIPYKLISPNQAVPNIIAIAFDGLRGETIVHLLEDRGFLIGTGSACNSKDTTNRVLDAMGIEKSLALGNIRISFEDCEKEDIIALAKAINECVSDYANKIKR